MVNKKGCNFYWLLVVSDFRSQLIIVPWFVQFRVSSLGRALSIGSSTTCSMPCKWLCFRQLRSNLLTYLHVTSLFFIPEEQVKTLSSQWSHWYRIISTILSKFNIIMNFGRHQLLTNQVTRSTNCPSTSNRFGKVYRRRQRLI